MYEAIWQSLTIHKLRIWLANYTEVRLSLGTDLSLDRWVSVMDNAELVPSRIVRNGYLKLSLYPYLMAGRGGLYGVANKIIELS